MRKIILILLMSTLAATSAWALPASTMKPPETMKLMPKGDTHWFLRSDLSAAAATRSATGLGLSAGRRFDHYWLDLSFMYYSTEYGAVHVTQPGIQPYGDSELARLRKEGDPGSMLAIGPGVGAMFRLFKSDRWVEMGRFGLSYMTFEDKEYNLFYKGALASFHGAVGYLLDPFLLSLGMTWNLGYVQRVASPQVPVNETEHFNFLPMQWWSFQLGILVWVL